MEVDLLLNPSWTNSRTSSGWNFRSIEIVKKKTRQIIAKKNSYGNLRFICFRLDQVSYCLQMVWKNKQPVSVPSWKLLGTLYVCCKHANNNNVTQYNGEKNNFILLPALNNSWKNLKVPWAHCQAPNIEGKQVVHQRKSPTLGSPGLSTRILKEKRIN
jgi:hypothetical protein